MAEPDSDGSDVPLPALADSALAERARGGDRAAFDELHRRFAPAVHGLLLAHRPAHDADDLLQEAFLSAWRRIETLRDLDRFGPWLLTIARHAAYGAANKSRTVAGRTEPLELFEGEVVSPALDGTADGNEILRLMRELPEAYRETLAMRLVEGWSGPEIAAATGLTHGSVRVNLHRGMQLLRERLRQEGYA